MAALFCTLLALIMCLYPSTTEARACTFNPPGWEIPRTLAQLEANEPRTWWYEEWLDFDNETNWICDGTYPNVPRDGDDVIINMTASACSPEALQGSRLIINTPTPLLNSVIVMSEIGCNLNFPCPQTPWQAAAAHFSEASVSHACVGALEVRGTLNTKYLEVQLYQTLNLNGGTIDVQGNVLIKGYVAGTGKIKANRVETQGSAQLWPGWHSSLIHVKLSSDQGCGNLWPRWAPNGERSAFGDLLFDTPYMLLNETYLRYKDLVNFAEFPGRAKPGTPHDTITITGTAALYFTRLFIMRQNNTGTPDFGWAQMEPNPTTYLWGPNSQLFTAGAYQALAKWDGTPNPSGFKLPFIVEHRQTGWQIGFLWYMNPQLPEALPTGMSGNLLCGSQISTACIAGDHAICDIIDDCAGFTGSTLSITLNSGTCPDAVAPTAVIATPPPDGSTTTPSNSGSGDGRSSSVPIAAIAVPVIVVGVGIAILVYVLWRRQVKKTTRQLQEFAKQASLQDLQDIKKANAALRMPH